MKIIKGGNMAINKEKNVAILITFPKEDAEHLETLRQAFINNGIKVSKSDILRKAFNDYLRILVMNAQISKEQKEKVEEPQKETKDA